MKISTMSLDVVRTGSTSFSLSTRIRLTPSVSRIHSCRALNSPSSVMMIFFPSGVGNVEMQTQSPEIRKEEGWMLTVLCEYRLFNLKGEGKVK